jgi:hypothetical protein
MPTEITTGIMYQTELQHLHDRPHLHQPVSQKELLHRHVHPQARQPVSQRDLHLLRELRHRRVPLHQHPDRQDPRVQREVAAAAEEDKELFFEGYTKKRLPVKRQPLFLYSRCFYSSGTSEALISLKLTYLPSLFTNRLI